MRAANESVRKRCKQHAPKGFGWTSLQINVNSKADWHVDHRNLGPSCLAVVGRFAGGELEVKGYRPTKLENSATMSNGREWHRNLPLWEGERVSLVAFIHETFSSATEEDKERLRDLGFVLPDEGLVKEFKRRTPPATKKPSPPKSRGEPLRKGVQNSYTCRGKKQRQEELFPKLLEEIAKKRDDRSRMQFTAEERFGKDFR